MDTMQVAWGWEMSQLVYLYTQLYVMPLVLMLVLSAMTLYRREMSCNRVYALEEEGSQQTLQRQGADQPLTRPHVVSLLTPLMWLKFDRGYTSEDDAPPLTTTEQTITVANRPSQQQQPAAGGHAKSAFSDFFGKQLSEDTQQALDKILSTVPLGTIRRLSEASLSMIPRRQRKHTVSSPLHPQNMPADVQCTIMSFLLPKEVVTFACASQSCRDIVDGDGPTPTAVWKTLWQRDYGWLMQSWAIGRRAFLRSKVEDLNPHGKEFYFRFGLSYVDYVLAGLNTPDRCYVGLHGNLYEITEFVLRHPGSPETLFVHAGRDATNLFDDMDHSKGARRLAKEFCIAVDMSYYGSCGLRPTIEFEADHAIPPIVEAKPVIGKKDRRHRQPECLKRVYEDFCAEQYQHEKALTLKLKDDKKVLHWTSYYDPYRRSRQAWYTTTSLETVFI